MYTYLFHRRINDGSFHLAHEKKETALPGLFGFNQKPHHKVLNQNANESSLDLRISQLLNIAKSQVIKNFLYCLYGSSEKIQMFCIQ